MNNMLILSALASSHGYSAQAFHNFAGSLASTGFKGKIVMMTTEENYDNHSLGNLEKDYSCLAFKFIQPLEDYGNINCYRYGYFREFLGSLTENHDYVMLTDSRDVIFQRDISSYPFDSAYDLFLAEEEKLIKDCGINSGWIQDLFGNSVLQELENKTVICSGTTIGKQRAILEYLDIMIDIVSNVEDQHIKKFGNLGGIDQGIHNYIYYKNLLPGLNIKPMHNQCNLIYTVGHVAGDDEHRQFLNSESKFINKEGRLCYCVHQYDRLDYELLRKFNRFSNYII